MKEYFFYFKSIGFQVMKKVYILAAAAAAAVVVIILLGVIGYLFYARKSEPTAPSPTTPAAQMAAQQDTALKGPGGELGATMQVYVNEQELVGFMELVDVSLTRNTRKVMWAYADNPALDQIYKAFESTKAGDTPWLSEDPATNKLQLSIINGAYACIPIGDTALPRRRPGIDEFIKFICVVAVPPDYGKFSGYLSAGLTRVPTQEEIYRVVERMRGFASRIY